MDLRQDSPAIILEKLTQQHFLKSYVLSCIKRPSLLLLYLHFNVRIIKMGCVCNWQPIESSLPSLAHSHGVCKSFIEFKGIYVIKLKMQSNKRDV